MNQHKPTLSIRATGGGQCPRLDLSGPWLEAAGFPAGSRVEVEVVEPGRLVVTRADLEGPLPNLLPLVWVPVEQLVARRGRLVIEPLEEAGHA